MEADGAIILHASVAIAYSDTRKMELGAHVEARLVIHSISLAILVVPGAVIA